MRSNVFNGTQPSNEGCTNGVSVDGQVTTDCGQGTTLIDCNRGYKDKANYSDLSNYFIWNRTASVDQQVSIVFRFDQQVQISRIVMLFWKSPSNSMVVPNVMIYSSNVDSITPSNEITTTSSQPRKTSTGDRRCRLIIKFYNSFSRQRFQYLRIVMNFYNGSEWIFLSEVRICGEHAAIVISFH